MAKKRGHPHTFMEFVLPIWEKRFPGCKPPVGTATFLAPVYEAVGDEEASNRLRCYLACTPAKYVNLSKFASMHGEFTDPPPVRAPLSVKATRVNPSPPTDKTVEVEWDPTTGRYKPRG
ncbi:MAG TPA: hypothetical protein VLK82_12485 [Candidatus Tectomicrobia bacterium]|nr:hypothetical protein [Candidatus Tectomicrobia bacterium]